MRGNSVWIIEWQSQDGKWLPDNSQHFLMKKDSKYFTGAESVLKNYRARNPNVKLRLRKYLAQGE